MTENKSVAVMQRYEMKYLLSKEKTEYLRRGLEGHMRPDAFGLSSIASLYYDTPDDRLIRASLEKPDFKEKLRLRSYGLADERSTVFLELKRKALGVVYKRRVATTVGQAEAFLAGGATGEGQIDRELTAFREYYGELRPACLIIYDRTAYFEPDGALRLTIDENPRYRFDGLTLTESMEGRSLLPRGWTILELKVQDAIPLWLTELLSSGEIYMGSFSKYGEAYRRKMARLAMVH